MIRTYALDLLPPGGMSLDLLGGGVEGSRAFSGDAGALDFSGGGLWSVKYRGIMVADRAQHLYVNRLKLQLNSRTRKIFVPILTDMIAPTPDAPECGPGALEVSGIPHSDGALFSDGAGYRQSTIVAEMAAAADLGAGTVTLRVISGGGLVGGEVFSLYHAEKFWRCYGVSEVDAVTDNPDGSRTYTVAVTPPLRDDIEARAPAKFDRPLCTMRLAPGETISWQPGPAWIQQGFEISFIEAM